MGVEAILGRLPAAALCWLVAALRLELGTLKLWFLHQSLWGQEASISQSDPEMDRQLRQKTLLPGLAH